jgi:hypothetical protein
MSTVNKARVWALVPSEKAKHLPRKFGELRLRGLVYQKNGKGDTRVGFTVPQDSTCQEAIILLHDLCPAGTEVHCD